MHIENILNELRFIADTPAEEDMEKRMSQYTFIQRGASIFIHSYKDKKLVSHFNPFDRTQLVLCPEGLEIAKALGAKRFLFLDATKATEQAEMLEEKEETKKLPTLYDRDRSFPLTSSAEPIKHPYRFVTLKQLLELKKRATTDVHHEFVDLFDRCANYLPEKQDEFKIGGSKHDKICRFNLEDLEAYCNTIFREQLFMLDDKDKIIGTISATACYNPDADPTQVDCYVYDEIVDYLSLLDPESETKKSIDEVLESKKLSKEERESKLAELIKPLEPLRAQLMAILFEQTRKELMKSLGLLMKLDETQLKQKVENGEVRALIRAASGREATYEQLGCSSKNPGIPVTLSYPTALGALLESYVKEVWAPEKLKEMKQTNTSSSFHQQPQPTEDMQQPLPTASNQAGMSHFGQ